MSGNATAPTSNSATNSSSADQRPAQPGVEQPPSKSQLEEDDEFEDFPVEDWPDNETSAAEGNTHLWEESWDDDDTTEDFVQILQEEMKKVDSSSSGKR